MTTTTHLLHRRRFLPLFLTQGFNAFNDNLYKTAMVLFVVYSIYDSPEAETGFSALASGLFILPFVVFSAISGELADKRDKARIIRWIKGAEILIMLVGAAGLMLALKGIAPAWLSMAMMLAALLAMGVHSTFFGPIKYAILPQHLKRDEVLAGTGLVEAGTYIAILLGTTLAGWIPVEWAAIGVLATAVLGFITAQSVPSAPALDPDSTVDWNIFRSSYRLIRSTTEDKVIFYTILAISFFWTIAAILSVQFPPLAKNVLQADKHVASLLLVSFSVGVAVGSVSINWLLKGRVSARFAPVSVIVMAGFVVCFYAVTKSWSTSAPAGKLLGAAEFFSQQYAIPLIVVLLLIAIAGGMFVVPLYAFLTTKVETSRAARTVAANNIMNSFFMAAGSLIAGLLGALGIPLAEQLLLSTFLCAMSAWLAMKLYRIEDTPRVW